MVNIIILVISFIIFWIISFTLISWYLKVKNERLNKQREQDNTDNPNVSEFNSAAA